MFDKIIEIKVYSGANQKSFLLHQGLLHHYSGYFTTVERIIEAKTGTVKLPEQDIQTFERFVLWLYARKIHQLQNTGEYFEALCRLWVLGDRLEVPLLTNCVIDAFRDEVVARWAIPTRHLQYIYQNTLAGSGLRRFAIWLISNTGGTSTVPDSERALWPEEALWDITKALFYLRETGPPILTKAAIAVVDMCTFHQHIQGERCPGLLD